MGEGQGEGDIWLNLQVLICVTQVLISVSPETPFQQRCLRNRLISRRHPFFAKQKNSDPSPSTMVLYTMEWQGSEFRDDGVKSSGEVWFLKILNWF